MRKDEDPCGCLGSKSVRELRRLVERLEREHLTRRPEGSYPPTGVTLFDVRLNVEKEASQ